MGKIVRSIQQDTVDINTGEILSKSIETTTVIEKEPPFVKLYLEDITSLYNLPNGCSSLLLHFVRKLDYDGIITLVSGYKKRIATTLKIKPQTIDNYIQDLLKKGILHRLGRGEYMMNPSLFAKGEWSNVRKLRKDFFNLSVTYSPDGVREIKGGVVDGDSHLQTSLNLN